MGAAASFFAGGGSVGFGAAVAGGAVGGFAGSVASQAAGMAMGMQDGINLRQAFAAAGTGALTAGVGNMLSAGAKGVDAAGNAISKSNAFVNIAENGSRLTALGQGIQGAASVAASAVSNKIVGLNSNFSWAGMAAGFAGGFAQGALGLNANIDPANGTFSSGKLLANTAQGFTGSALSATAQRVVGVGGKQNWGAMVADSFGNALGSSIAIKYNLSQKGAAFGEKSREKFDAAIESLKSLFQKDQSSYMFANANMSDYFRMSAMDRWDLDSSEGILDASGLPVRLSGPGSVGSDTGLGADLSIDPVEQADLQRVLDKENRQMDAASMHTSSEGAVNEDFEKVLMLSGSVEYKDSNKVNAKELQSLLGFKGKGADGDFGPTSWLAKEIHNPTKETLNNIVTAGGDKAKLQQLYKSVQKANENYIDSTELDGLIAANNSYSKMPNETVKAVIMVESRGNAGARNPTSSASGLMQVTDIALRQYNIDNKASYTLKDLLSPSINIKVGTGVMKSMETMYKLSTNDQVIMRYHGNKDSAVNSAYLEKVKTEVKNLKVKD